MSAYKQVKKRTGKIPVFLSANGPKDSYKLPEMDQITDTMLYDPDDIEEYGRKLMRFILDRCSGNFVKGMRDVMIENPRHFQYKPTSYNDVEEE